MCESNPKLCTTYCVDVYKFLSLCDEENMQYVNHPAFLNGNCLNDSFQVVNCGGDTAICYDVARNGYWEEVPCGYQPPVDKKCFGHEWDSIECIDIYSNTDRMCWYSNSIMKNDSPRFDYWVPGDEKNESFQQYIARTTLVPTPCNDVISCIVYSPNANGDMRGDIGDCNTTGSTNCNIGYFDEVNWKNMPADLIVDRNWYKRDPDGGLSMYRQNNCVSNKDGFVDPFVSDFGFRDQFGKLSDRMSSVTVSSTGAMNINHYEPSHCYDENGYKIDCKTFDFLPIPDNPDDLPYLNPFEVSNPDLPNLDCDICQFFENCQTMFLEWRSNFWHMMESIYVIKDFQWTLEAISNATNNLYNLSGFVQGFFPNVLGSMHDLIEEIRDLLRDGESTEPTEPTEPVEPTEPEDNTDFIKELFKYLSDIKDLLSDLKIEIVNEAGTNLWDFLSGLFDNLFELVEFLVDKIIYLVIPEDSSFITTSLSGLSDALNSKFESMNVVKDKITSSLQVEERMVEDVTVSLPAYGAVKVLDATYLNMAIPKIRQILSGMMILLTAFWAYRKITSELIK